MSNEELKKKITKIIGDVYLINAPIKDMYKPIFMEKIADALIAAGIGDIRTWKHRAEVAEMALLTACVNLIKDEADNVDMELLAHVVYTNYLRKAEKELAEGKE